jgi:PAS domain S-box-containing protein
MHGNDLFEKRKHAERILREKEKKYRIMSDNMTDGVAMIKNGKIEYISPSYKRMLALDEDVSLDTFSEAMKNVPETYINKTNEQFDNAVKIHKETIKYRYPVNLPNGHHIWIEDNLKLIWDKDKKLICTYINGRDVTEQVLNENKLKEAQKRVEKANKAKTEFMMNMSHELRTPLNGVIGFSNILKGTNLDKDQLDYLTNIIVSGIRLLDIVNDILDFSKIETYKMKLKYEAVSLRKTLDNLMNLINRNVEKKKISTELIVDEDVPEFVMMDSMKLSQILGNLLMNALKFTKEGKITLSVQLFTKNRSQAIVKFSVNDTGVGIDESIKKKIFESFTQGDSTITRGYGGTGLGLSISNGILKLMGSRLNLSSAPLMGSKFSFILTLDICKNTDEKTTALPVLEKEEYKQLKILIAEDNEINLKLNKIIIRRHYPYAKIIDACNGKDALQKYMEHRPDLILMDIRMPEINGLESTKIIRDSFKDSEVIIIGLSAEAHKDKINEGISVGMDDYITKPVIPNELIKVINKYI